MAMEPVGFQTSMIGFRKADVLAYIDRMSAENLAAQKKADEDVQELNRLLATATDEKEVLSVALGEKKEEIALLHKALTTQTELATVAQAQAQVLSNSLEKSEEVAHEYQGKLFAREGEATVLRRDNAKLVDSLAQKQTELDHATAQIESVQQSAKETLASEGQRLAAQNSAMQQDMRDAAGDMAQEVILVKQALAALDARIADSLADLQQSTKALSQVLEVTEHNVQALGVKLEVFPEQIKTQAAEAPRAAQVPSVKRATHMPARCKVTSPTISSLLLAKITKMIGDV